MLYNKNRTESLQKNLFKNPTSEYRGTPFWAWNGKLDKDLLLWEIDKFQEMGFGGFIMHSRCGMNTKYLSNEFMKNIAACVYKAKSNQMKSLLYDEDRWPSGAAGGFVTKDPKNREKYMVFTSKTNIDDICASIGGSAGYFLPKEIVDPVTGYNTGKPYLLACYDVVLNNNGTLKEYAKISEDEVAKGKKWCVYVGTPSSSGWYNNQTYVDTLSKDAIAKFIKITYDKYKSSIGGEFGKTIPAIFTDEPQFAWKNALSFSYIDEDISMPYTTNMEDEFLKRYGYNILDFLPELLWDFPDKPSLARYHYHDFICQLFTEAYSMQCGKWCEENGILLTGHVLFEESLHLQTTGVGEAMRAYQYFQIPGIDILCNGIEFATAKQAQSVVHQYGKEGMSCEMYGVTGWGFDFKGYKFQGDWLAALGVTMRIPHLSWMCMKGSAKRDYPASINYQSCWFEKYDYIESHFARLNTALTRGKAQVRIAVIHPIESYWIVYGSQEYTSFVRNNLEDNFQNLIQVLLRNALDFDFISESLLPSLYKKTDDGKFLIGKMKYDVVVIPPLYTIRESTLDALIEYKQNKGNIIFIGNMPKYVDGKVSEKVMEIYNNSKKIAFSAPEIVNNLEEFRDISITDDKGRNVQNLIYNMRIDGKRKWLMIAHCDKIDNSEFFDRREYDSQSVFIKVKGRYKVELYDTLSGEIRNIGYKVNKGITSFQYAFFASDSLLVALDETFEGDVFSSNDIVLQNPDKIIEYVKDVDYSLTEKNVLVLDICEWSYDGYNWFDREEILRIDEKVRKEFKYPRADGTDCQPWTIEVEDEVKYIYLRFTFESTIETDCIIAYEEANEIIFNGENVILKPGGYFTDKSINTVNANNITIGRNVLIARVPIGKRTSIENFFILGNFGVKIEGAETKLIPPKQKLYFGSIAEQGLPFYGAKIIYKVPFAIDKDSKIRVKCPMYSGALVTVTLDGMTEKNMAFSPFEANFCRVCKGDHLLEFTLYSPRTNCFGALHDCVNHQWKGPDTYYTKGDEWSYEYNIQSIGILKSPKIEIFNEDK